jgi:transposase
MRKEEEKLKKRFLILSKVLLGMLRQKQAAKELGISVRHVRRLKKRLKQNNLEINCLRYRRSHPCSWRIPDSIREKVINLKTNGRHRSCRHIADLLKNNLTKEEKIWLKKFHKDTISWKTVARILRRQKIRLTSRSKQSPAVRFEKENFGELVQIDAHHVSNLLGYRRIKLIAVLDDHSRAILGGRFFVHETTYNTLSLLREVIKKYGIFQAAYSDNNRIYNFILHTKSSMKVCRGDFRFYDWKTNPDEVLTVVERALLELNIPFFHHAPGNAQATGKLERLWPLIENRFIKEYKNNVKSLKQLNAKFQKWINWYNFNWVNRDIKTTPSERFSPSVFRPLSENINLDDIFCLKSIRKVAKDNSFSFDGVLYVIPHKYNLVACKIELHIHPGKKIRIFHQNKFICELKWKNKKQDILTVQQGKKPFFKGFSALKKQINRRKPYF